MKTTHSGSEVSTQNYEVMEHVRSEAFMGRSESHVTSDLDDGDRGP
jgi:hypothetical protein